MMFHSSFLIRCWVDTSLDPVQVKAYHIQHVQSGDDFRSADLSEINRWMAAENSRFFAGSAGKPSEAPSREDA